MRLPTSTRCFEVACLLVVLILSVSPLEGQDPAAGRPEGLRTVGNEKTRHAEHVYCIDFSPDGTLLASGGDHGTVKVWETSGRTLSITLDTGLDRVQSVAFSPDGTYLAAAAEGIGEGDHRAGVTLWETAGWKKLNTYDRGAKSLAFSPDGTRLASSTGRTVEVWKITGGRVIHRLREDESRVGSFAFSPDGAKIALGTGDEGSVKLWDVASGQVVRTLKEEVHSARSLSFSPDGSVVLAGGWHSPWSLSGFVALWETSSGELIH